MEKLVYLSDQSLLSAPNFNHFITSVFYTQKKEFYDIPLDSPEALFNSSDFFFKNMNNYLSGANYKYENGYHCLGRTFSEQNNNIQVSDNINYKLNKYLFRSDQFTTEHENLHILFAGCSETFGEGGNIEDSWSYRLHRQIELNNKTSGYFNVSSPGLSWEDIIHNVKRYVELFGSPDILFIFAPNILRYREYEKKHDRFVMAHKYPSKKKNKKFFKAYSEKFISWLYLFNLFISYCNELGIKVIFSSWSLDDSDNYMRIPGLSDYFFHLQYIASVVELENNYENLQPEDILRRDKNHRGNIYHITVANKFIEQLNSNTEKFNLDKIEPIDSILLKKKIK